MIDLIEPPDPGIYEDVPMEEYHRWRACSSSQISKLDQSPAHLRASLEEEFEETPATKLGSMIHTAILEPQRFEDDYVVLGTCEAIKKSDGEPCTNDARYINDGKEFCGTHGDAHDHDDSKIAVKQGDMEVCRKLQECIERKQAASLFLDTADSREMTMVWDDPLTGARCKGRVDSVSQALAGGCLVDLKTTRSADERSFRKAMLDYSYHYQAILYLMGAEALEIPAEHFVILAGEKKPPYEVRPFKICEGVIEETAEHVQNLIEVWGECMDKKVFPGYPDEVRSIDIPTWGYKIQDQNEAELHYFREMISDA